MFARIFAITKTLSQYKYITFYSIMVTYPNIFIGLVLSGVIDYMDCGIVLNFNQNIAICLVFILFNQYMFFFD